MAESRRSGDQSGIIMKNRSSTGCLIVRKKSEDVSVAGSSGTRKVFESKKEKKRPRMVMSDSGSSDELLMPPRRRVGAETLRVCNGLSVLEKGGVEESEFRRKRDRDRVERIRHNDDDLIGRNDGHSDRKRNRLDVFEFDEYDGVDGEMMRRRKHLENSRVDIGGRRFLGPMAMGRSGIESQFNTSSSRNVVDKRKNLFLERTSSFNQGGMNRFGMDRDAGRMPISLLREKYMGDSDEPIRLQGKNGVLKVMVNKKKKMGEPVKKYDHLDTEENLNSFRDSTRNVPIRPPSYLETEVLEKPSSFVRTEKNHINLQKSLSAKKSKDADSDSDDSDTALKLGPKRTEARKSLKEVSSESEKTPAGKLTLTGTKEGKVRRGSGTEKQKLREKIRGMLVEAGWTIDYRPRRNRDYLDAVYINPSGTAYWSIIKAYDALLKQLNDEEEEVKPPLSDEVLSQLTRKTRKKIEKELKKKQRDGSQSVNTREAAAKKSSSARHDEESMGSISHEEKLSSFLKQGGKSSKSRMNENGVAGQNSKGQSSTHHLHDGDEKPSSASNSHLLHGRKSRKLGRCTLLVRSSNGGPNSETDGFVPYAGKRTLLSWLIDSGTVQLSQKVQYMNRRRTKVMLEGWITRDGIHCGCCSKILTVSKFEIHAGSKLRQPFQNIYLDSGDSLLQCQIDAWNRQEDSERIGFDSVDIDGDDPNDDTCGICGDGGDLICCDGCPSTFHQNCLDIQMLPAGDWHCPNCTCKFCGSAGEDIDEGSDVTTCSLLTCSMCEKKYHKLCMHDMDAVPVYSNCSVTFFCGQTCREVSISSCFLEFSFLLFEHLQKYLGVKQELESGFSWSLIHRTGEDSDTMLRGLPQRVESNSKLAVALTVMDECFLPIVDRRSGVNLIHNVLYNSGSNFNRLNYSGFYTAILERGDEIISAASIRYLATLYSWSFILFNNGVFHGTQLAEMPFIGTRHIYRRQGMCRRLFCALESALCSLKVEKLVIPAIAELMHTWTGIFGFTPLEESLKQETRSLNMLVFPGIDMLQKLLLEEESVKENMKARTGSQKTESEAKAGVTPEVANESNIDSSAEHDPDKCADSGLIHADLINGEVAATDSDSKCPDVSLNGTSVLSGSSEGPTNVLVEGTTCPDSQSGDKLAESASDGKCLSNSDTSNDEFEMRNKEVDMDVVHAVDVNVSASHEVEIPVSAVETVSPNSQLGDKLAESASAKNCLSTAGISHDALEKGNKPELNSAVEDNTEFSTDSDVDDVHAVAANSAASHEVEVSVEETLHPGSDLGSKSAGFASERKILPAPGISADAIDMENNQLSDSPLQDNLPSCKEGDTNDACSMDVNIATSHEVEFPVTVERSVSSDSKVEDKFVESVLNKSLVFDKNHDMQTELNSPVKEHPESFKDVDMVDAHSIDTNIASPHEVKMPVSVEGFCGTSDDALDMHNRPASDDPVKYGTQSCREDDGWDTDKNVAASDEVKIPISVAGSSIVDSQAEGKSSEPASEQEFPLSKASHDELQINQNSSHSPSEDNIQSQKEGNPDNLDDKVAHPDSAPCPGDITADNTTEASIEISVDALSSMQITTDSNDHVTCEKVHKLVSSEDACEATVCEESSVHPCSNGVQNACA
ncbi:hypothetical protein Pint_24823 [Pistacia integerrima]|uniref:Uncharacterized protein n=1 Tax=Pistacia integerrima TaxID=434235 RepID=A0ACC0YJ59_9ROSI|nr:hypothetical protein Pint_24823 [Pistacia integerrima]